MEEYQQAELLQAIGRLYMDATRSHATMRHMQQLLQEKDELLSQYQTQEHTPGSDDECRPTDPTAL